MLAGDMKAFSVKKDALRGILKGKMGGVWWRLGLAVVERGRESRIGDAVVVDVVSPVECPGNPFRVSETKRGSIPSLGVRECREAHCSEVSKNSMVSPAGPSIL